MFVPSPCGWQGCSKVSLSKTSPLLHAQAWAYSCPGSPRRTPWPPIILQTSLPAWLLDLDKPPTAHPMSVTSQHHPVSLGQMVWAPKSLTDRDWEPQPTRAASCSFLWLFRGREPTGERQHPCRGYKPMYDCPSCFLPV